MGCFNVNCAISGLSIEFKETALFIPLQKNTHFNDIICLNAEDIYFPFSLPIEGIYNDYGSLENIKMDTNTRTIENYFGITIDLFMELITDKREPFSSLSRFFKPFNVKDFGFDRLSDSNYLEEYGFKKLNENEYTYENKIKINFHKKPIKEKGEIKYYLTYVSFNNGKEYMVELWNDIQKYMFKETGHILSNPEISKEEVNKINELASLSGMFIKKEIYDFLSEKQNYEFFQNYREYIENLKNFEEEQAKRFFKRMLFMTFKSNFFDYYYTYENFKKDKTLPEKINSFYNFSIEMTTIGKIFSPGVGGSQYYNNEEILSFAKKVEEISKKVSI